jgi:hypothetical protein
MKMGSPAAPERFGLSPGQVAANARKIGARLSSRPPPEHYIEDERETAVVYKPSGGNYHFVAINSRENERIFTFTDYQTSSVKDVTDEFRGADRENMYIYRPNFDDLEEEKDDDDDDLKYRD